MTEYVYEQIDLDDEHLEYLRGAGKIELYLAPELMVTLELVKEDGKEVLEMRKA